MVETLSSWDGRRGAPRLEEYARRYEDLFVLTRKDGVLEVRMHTNGGPFRASWQAHNAWSQLWNDVGRDPENEVMILTGTGDFWLTADLDELWHTPLRDWTDDSKLKMHCDMVKLLESFIFAIDIPTIAAVNGPGGHLELALLCDLTLCAPDVQFSEPHFMIGAPPGDGLMLALQRTMGVKRASYHAYTGRPVDALAARDLGLINEVLPRETVLPRAWALAEMIMQRPRITRHLTHAITAQAWKRALVDDLAFHVGHQMLPMVLGGEAPAALARRHGLHNPANQHLGDPGKPSPR